MAPVLKEITVCLRVQQCNKVLLPYVMLILSDVKFKKRGKLIGIKMRNFSRKKKGGHWALKDG